MVRCCRDMWTVVMACAVGACDCGPVSHGADAQDDAAAMGDASVDRDATAERPPCDGASWFYAEVQTPYGGVEVFDCDELYRQVEMLFDARFCTFNGTQIRESSHRLNVLAGPPAYAEGGPIGDGIHVGITGGEDPYCPPGRVDCFYNAFGDLRCEAEVIQAGSAPGDTVEIRLAEPCELRGGDGLDGPFPTVLRMHVRGRLNDEDRPDSGLCDRDGGV